jgi:cell wall-associated NlpC family hydrolase
MTEMVSAAGLTGVIVLTALSAAACVSAGPRPRPEPFPRPGAAEPKVECPAPNAECAVTPLADGLALVNAALDLRGTPYAPGGSGPDRFDCSGLVQYVFAEFGIALPRTVTRQFDATVEVPFEQLAPGDLLFFRTAGEGPSHVAIAVGDGTFVHAPSSRGVVRVESLASSYWRGRFDSARRVR